MDTCIKNRSTIFVVILWAALLSILIYSNAHAVEAVSNGKAELSADSGTFSGEGNASTLLSDDVEEAKGKALEAAKNEAVLKVAGLHVNPEMLAKDKKNLVKAFKPRLDEVITEYKIISETREDNGFLRIKISAKINEDMVKDIIMKNLNDDRVVVITSEKNTGTPLKRHILEHEIIKTVKDKGYQIVDYRTERDNTIHKLVSSIRQGDTAAVKRLGIYYLTDIVVVGFVETEFSEQTKDIYSARATGQVKIHRIGNKTEILSLTKHNEKGFGSDKERAGIDAIKKISAKMSSDVMKNLPSKSIKKITLKIKEISSHASLEKTKRMLADIPYVKEVREGISNFDIEETTLYVETTRGIDYISKKLAEMKVFVVKKVNGSEILAEARKI